MPSSATRTTTIGLMLAGLLAIAGMVSSAGSTPASGTSSAEALAFNCYTCHSAPAASASIPTLDGISADDMLRRLLEFKQGGGDPTIMGRIAKGYSDEELAQIANYLAGLGKAGQ